MNAEVRFGKEQLVESLVACLSRDPRVWFLEVDLVEEMFLRWEDESEGDE